MPQWWDELGAYSMGLSGFPALSADMALNGPRGDFGYTLVDLMNRTPTPLELYPNEGEG